MFKRLSPVLITIVIIYISGSIYLYSKFGIERSLLSSGVVIILFSILSIANFFGGFKEVIALLNGRPTDEMTLRIEAYAASYAFRLSIMLWVWLALFHPALDTISDVLGVGLIGPLVIHRFVWIYLKKRGLPHEN